MTIETISADLLARYGMTESSTGEGLNGNRDEWLAALERESFQLADDVLRDSSGQPTTEGSMLGAQVQAAQIGPGQVPVDTPTTFGRQTGLGHLPAATGSGRSASAVAQGLMAGAKANVTAAPQPNATSRVGQRALDHSLKSLNSAETRSRR